MKKGLAKKRIRILKNKLKFCKRKKVALKRRIRELKQEVEIVSDIVQPTCGELDVRICEWRNNRDRHNISSGWTVEAYINYKSKMLMKFGFNKIKSSVVRTQITRDDPLTLILQMQMLAERLNLKLNKIRYFVVYPKKGTVEMKEPEPEVEKNDKLQGSSKKIRERSNVKSTDGGNVSGERKDTSSNK